MKNVPTGIDTCKDHNSRITETDVSVLPTVCVFLPTSRLSKNTQSYVILNLCLNGRAFTTAGALKDIIIIFALASVYNSFVNDNYT